MIFLRKRCIEIFSKNYCGNSGCNIYANLYKSAVFCGGVTANANANGISSGQYKDIFRNLSVLCSINYFLDVSNSSLMYCHLFWMYSG